MQQSVFCMASQCFSSLLLKYLDARGSQGLKVAQPDMQQVETSSRSHSLSVSGTVASYSIACLFKRKFVRSLWYCRGSTHPPRLLAGLTLLPKICQACLAPLPVRLVFPSVAQEKEKPRRDQRPGVQTNSGISRPSWLPEPRLFYPQYWILRTVCSASGPDDQKRGSGNASGCVASFHYHVC